ncbi:MAG: hemolysin III family protein [Solirubrobacteraceae bacterium]|jgi:hemolysin III|nr:hemolysin III family protein [Solirubrobacteraceae bacterium]
MTRVALHERLGQPRLRGVSHAYAFWAAALTALALVTFSPAGPARVGAAVYGAGLCALFGGSGLYHRWRWDVRWRALLRRIDHSSIFVFIAASYTPIALLVLHGTTRPLVLAVVWLGAAGGVLVSVVWIDAPRALSAGLYLALGWVALLALPQLVAGLPAWPLALITLGGVLYSIGAVVYATKRPDPWPATFGYHEVFHAFVIAAAITHVVAIAGWVLPAG